MVAVLDYCIATQLTDDGRVVVSTGANGFQVTMSLDASGLTPRSLYQEDADPTTSDTERAARRAINTSLRKAYTGYRFDAVGQLSRREMSVVMLTSCIVAGDAFAIRLWNPDRPGRP